MAEQDSSAAVETVALITFFAGFALGVHAERTNIPERATPVAAVALATPSEAPAPSALALRGATGLFQLGGAVIP